MRTSNDLPDDLFRNAKTRAVQQGSSLKQLMTQFIRLGSREQAYAHVAGSQRALPPAATVRFAASPSDEQATVASPT